MNPAAALPTRPPDLVVTTVHISGCAVRWLLQEDGGCVRVWDEVLNWQEVNTASLGLVGRTLA